MNLINADVNSIAERKNDAMLNCHLSKLDYQDARETSIKILSEELYDQLSDDDYLEIEDKIRIAFGWNDINPDSVQAALMAICYVEAEYRFNEKNKRSFY
ncbi:hypothetical protein [Gilliamella mensalis]|uniref:hypothetical protein n=1 Tax=Gilliamella mensalis TaxID=1908520 RepID=UPI000A153930|nr:hypothetical protein [Gilliamella mensalis]